MDLRVSSPDAFREARAYWSDFVSKCISRRLDTDRFELYVPLVHVKYPLPASVVADVFLRTQPYNTSSLDPRVPPYVQVLFRLGYVDVPSVLNALYKYSSSQVQLRAQEHGGCEGGEETKDSAGQPKKQAQPWINSYWAEEVMFYHAIKRVVEGSAFRDSHSVLEMLLVMSRWMQLFTAASNAFATDMLGQMQDSQARHEMEMSRAAFLPLLLRLPDQVDILKAVRKPYAKDVRKQLSESLANFLPTLQLAPQFVEKLERFCTETLTSPGHVDKRERDTEQAVDELLDSAVSLENFVVPELSIPSTRAALYVHLNASLVGRPVMDDNALFSYMNARYQGDTQSCAVDLILASFDILANAVFRHDGEKDAHLLRSYLINKVPLLLGQLCPRGFSNISAEFCITEALNQVDTTMFPTASLMFDESRETNQYTESVREEFCAACALHGLVEREHVDRILGEVSMSYEPSLEKYSTDKLVQNCLSDPDRIQGLIRELDKMDGNVGAVARALVELLRQFCSSRDTSSLKVLCSQLAQKPKSLDVLLLFERLPTILEPLCHLLDSWRHDDDQVEYQPVYDEFGAILLLVFAFAYRYELSVADVAFTSSDSYVSRILGQAHMSQEHDEMSEQSNRLVGSWISGLFDSEAGGLGDDLMSSCIPQEFYLLVATVFKNVMAGYENLVDTFLLPSLVPAVRYLSDYLWMDKAQQGSCLKILQLILCPSSISGEASAMLASVKNLVAKPLEYSLRAAQHRDPKNQDVAPLLDALKDNIPLSRRTGSAEEGEVESWAGSSSTGIVGAVRHTFQGLVQWGMHPGAHVLPAYYCHRQITAGIEVASAKRILHVALNEIRQQSETAAVGVAYDVATALVCAPDGTDRSEDASSLLGSDANGQQKQSFQGSSLREALKSEAEDCRRIQKNDPTLAEIVVRLHRRVEAQLAAPLPHPMLGEGEMQLGLDGGTGGLGNAMPAASRLNGNAMQVDGDGIDMGLGSVSGDLDLGSVASANGGSLDAAADADLFSLDASMDFDNWDSMNL